jgi:hypothetical protein
MVTVTKVDREARKVTFRNPQGALHTIEVPKEAQNLDQVKPGARFKIVYVEAAAVALRAHGTPAEKVSETLRLAPKGGNPGGVAVRTAELAGVVDAIDYKTRHVAVRGPKGNVVSLRATGEVRNLDQVRVGDRISVVYTQSLALEMVPQPAKEMKPAKK